VRLLTRGNTAERDNTAEVVGEGALQKVCGHIAHAGVAILESGDDDGHAFVGISAKRETVKARENRWSKRVFLICKGSLQYGNRLASDPRECVDRELLFERVGAGYHQGIQCRNRTRRIGSAQYNRVLANCGTHTVCSSQPMGDNFVLGKLTRQFPTQRRFPWRRFYTHPRHVHRQSVCTNLFQCMPHRPLVIVGWIWPGKEIRPLAQIAPLILGFISWTEKPGEDQCEQQRTDKKNAFAAVGHGVAILEDWSDWASGHEVKQ